MSLESLDVFLMVSEFGSFSAAGRELGLNASSVMKRIDALELAIGGKLFARSTRQLTLTEAGAAFRERTIQIVRDFEDAKAEVSSLDGDVRGVLRVTAPVGFGRRHLATAIRPFVATHPRIEIDLRLSDNIVDLIEQRYDLAIRVGTLADNRLVATMLAPQTRIACASPGYLSRMGRPLTPNDLLRHECLTVSPHPPAGMWCFGRGQDWCQMRVTGHFRSDTTEALVAAALEGAGVVHLPAWLVGEYVANGQLVPLLEEHHADRSVIGAIYFVRPPRRRAPAKVAAFIHHLRSCFGTPPYWEKYSSARFDAAVEASARRLAVLSSSIGKAALPGSEATQRSEPAYALSLQARQSCLSD